MPGFLGKNAVMIVAQPAATEVLKIGEPVEISHGDLEPVGQRSNGFNGGNRPGGSGRNGLHAVGVGDPTADRELLRVLGTRTLESFVKRYEFDYVAMSRTDISRRSGYEPFCHRREPVPWPAQAARAARDNGIHGWLAGQNGARENASERGLPHDELAAEFTNESDSA
jgi:hypothetical protein